MVSQRWTINEAMSCCETDLLECCYLGISLKGAENKVEVNIQGWTPKRALTRHIPNHSRHCPHHCLSSVKPSDFHLGNLSRALVHHCLWTFSIEKMGSLARNRPILPATSLRSSHVERGNGELFRLSRINFHAVRRRLCRIHSSIICSLRVCGCEKKQPSVIRIGNHFSYFEANGFSHTSAVYQPWNSWTCPQTKLYTSVNVPTGVHAEDSRRHNDWREKRICQNVEPA